MIFSTGIILDFVFCIHHFHFNNKILVHVIYLKDILKWIIFHVSINLTLISLNSDCGF